MVPSHQKALIFASIFHQIFMVFPTPLPEVIFRGTLRRSRPKSAIFNGFWTPAGPQNGPLEHHFRPKRRQKGYPANGTKRPGADLGAICCRKRPKDAFSLNWDRFGLILEGFSSNFEGFSKIFPRLLRYFFQISSIYSSRTSF